MIYIVVDLFWDKSQSTNWVPMKQLGWLFSFSLCIWMGSPFSGFFISSSRVLREPPWMAYCRGLRNRSSLSRRSSEVRNWDDEDMLAMLKQNPHNSFKIRYYCWSNLRTGSWRPGPLETSVCASSFFQPAWANFEEDWTMGCRLVCRISAANPLAAHSGLQSARRRCPTTAGILGQLFHSSCTLSDYLLKIN